MSKTHIIGWIVLFLTSTMVMHHIMFGEGELEYGETYTIELLPEDNAPNNSEVDSIWDCEEGCLYAEWVTFGYKSCLEPSTLYEECARLCNNNQEESKTSGRSVSCVTKKEVIR